MKTMIQIVPLLWVECNGYRTTNNIRMVGSYHLALFQSHVIRSDGTCFVSVIFCRVCYWDVAISHFRSDSAKQNGSNPINNSFQTERFRILNRMRSRKKEKEKVNRLCCRFQFIFACILHCNFFTGSANGDSGCSAMAMGNNKEGDGEGSHKPCSCRPVHFRLVNSRQLAICFKSKSVPSHIYKFLIQFY